MHKTFKKAVLEELKRTKKLTSDILTEKDIVHGDILARVRPIGGFRMIDGNEADDKIIAVLKTKTNTNN